MSTNAASASGETVHNDDIRPRTDPRYPDIDPLLRNRMLWKAFDLHETCAKRLKKRYERFSRFSVILIGGGALYATFRWVAGEFPFYRYLDLPFAAIGLLGLVLDIYLRRSNLKLTWLINRFAAERLRSVKFQVYAIATFAKDAAELSLEVNSWTAAMIAQIRLEIGRPSGALNTFHPPSAIQLGQLKKPPDAPSDDQRNVLRQAIADYREMRIRYQHGFGKQMASDIADRRRVYDSWGDGLFVLGAIVLVSGLALRFFLADELPASPYASLPDWLEAAGIAFFIGTAMGNVLAIGAAHLANDSRFQQYQRDTQFLLTPDPQTPAEFVTLLKDMELLALRELDDFWRDSWISSYR